MGELFDFGRNEKDREPAAPAAPKETYSAPDLRKIYETYKATGQVPYSYYGQGAPTNAEELALVRGSYPGAFTQAAQPQPAPQMPGRPSSIFDRLFGALFQGGRGLGQFTENRQAMRDKVRTLFPNAGGQ